VSHSNDGTSTELYLVRIWRRKSGDGALNLHGKVQHVVSGESAYFDELPDLCPALEKMIEQRLTSLGPTVVSPAGDGRDLLGDDQNQGGLR
jgi:hypothetical protein